MYKCNVMDWCSQQQFSHTLKTKDLPTVIQSKDSSCQQKMMSSVVTLAIERRREPINLHHRGRASLTLADRALRQ
jgi:hypothetical protein